MDSLQRKWLRIEGNDTVFCLNKSEIKAVLILGEKYKTCTETVNFLQGEARNYDKIINEQVIAIGKAELISLNKDKIIKNNEGIIVRQQKVIKIGKYALCFTGGLSVVLFLTTILK